MAPSAGSPARRPRARAGLGREQGRLVARVGALADQHGVDQSPGSQPVQVLMNRVQRLELRGRLGGPLPGRGQKQRHGQADGQERERAAGHRGIKVREANGATKARTVPAARPGMGYLSR